MVTAYAFVDLDGKIDIDSVGESPERVRENVLKACMGWQYSHPENYSREEEWKNRGAFGSVRAVAVSICD